MHVLFLLNWIGSPLIVCTYCVYSLCCLYNTVPNEEIRLQVHKLSENLITTGVHELGVISPEGAMERAFHVVQMISVAVELLVWAAWEDTGECLCEESQVSHIL